MPKKAKLDMNIVKEKEAKFKRIANKRIKQAIKYLRLLENMPKQPSYSYTTEDIEKLREALSSEYEKVIVTLTRASEGTLKGKHRTEIEDVL